MKPCLYVEGLRFHDSFVRTKYRNMTRTITTMTTPKIAMTITTTIRMTRVGHNRG